MRRLTRPLFRIDAGWLYLAAGLVLCAAGVLLPAATGSEDLRVQLDQLEAAQAAASQRLAAYAEFVEALERDDPALLRRLAAAHLNIVPAGETPLLISSTASQTEREWIDALVPSVSVPQARPRTSMLALLSAGRARLWLLGGGILAVFVGLVLGVSREVAVADSRSGRAPVAEAVPRATVMSGDGAASRPGRLAA